MSRWARRIGLLLGLFATAAFLLYALRTLRGQDFSRYASASAITGIGIAALAYSLIIPLSALAWQRLLKPMGVGKGWCELGIIMSITQLAKYIPGNIGQHIGRAAMSVGRGIPLRPYSISVLIEAMLAVIAAVIVGVAACALSGMTASMLMQHSALTMTTILLVACAFGLAMIVARYALPRLLQRLTSRHAPEVIDVALPPSGALAYALIVYLLNYVMFGIGITVMVLLLLPSQPAHWLLLTGSFALAWVTGFFAPGAPAGLGVREGILLALLQLSYTPAAGLMIVIALRLATTAGDILCFLTGSALLFLANRSAARNHLTGDHHEA